MCMSIHDTGIILNGRMPWYPLETVLEAWLDMIHKGKVRAVGTETEYCPWEIVSYSQTILDETVETFNKLVEAIESRLPEHTTNTEDTTTGLADDSTLEEFPQGFALDFMQRVRRPRFRFIAPGLEIPSSSSILDQPFSPLLGAPGTDGFSQIPPMLLFRSTTHYHDAPPTAKDILPFGWLYSQLTRFPAGLYLQAGNRGSSNPFDDECVLVLPYGIGANGYARTSDGALFGENSEAAEADSRDMAMELYQPGHQPFTEIHGVRLDSVLRSWLGMVERGDWKVDGGGVVSGMEEWRKADTGSEWEKYVVPVSW